MPVYIAYIKEDHYFAEWLADGLRTHDIEVLPLHPIKARAWVAEEMNKAAANIFVWAEESAKNVDMNEAKINAEIHRRYIPLDVDVTQKKDNPYAKLNSNVNQLYERLRGLGVGPSETRPWDPFLVYGVLIGIILLFFFYLNGPTSSAPRQSDRAWPQCSGLSRDETPTNFHACPTM